MNVLITGAGGFIGKNLVMALQEHGDHLLFQYDHRTPKELLAFYVQQCEFVFHLAGINRAEKEDDFWSGNVALTKELLELLQTYENHAPVFFPSSIHAAGESAYGTTKRLAEELMFIHAANIQNKVFVYRLPHVFGRWARPNYNSCIATFCSNIAQGLPLTVHHPDAPLELVHVDEVTQLMIRALDGHTPPMRRYTHLTGQVMTVAQVASLLTEFDFQRRAHSMPQLCSAFERALYSTLVSYAPLQTIPLEVHGDERGAFTELVRTRACGQISVNIIKPGKTKGNHYHHHKCERFFAVSGRILVRMRRVGDYEIHTVVLDGSRMEQLEVPPGVIHAMTNVAADDGIVVIHSSDCYCPEQPDTYGEQV